MSDLDDGPAESRLVTGAVRERWTPSLAVGRLPHPPRPGHPAAAPDWSVTLEVGGGIGPVIVLARDKAHALSKALLREAGGQKTEVRRQGTERVAK